MSLVGFRVRSSLAAALVAVLATGCSFTPPGKSAERRSQSSASQAVRNEFDPGTADFCQETMAKDPTRPFHFSSLRTQIGTSDLHSVEADVAPQRIDLTNRTSLGRTTNHYQRSDKSGWAAAVTIMAVSSPWMDRNMAKFNMKKLGSEKINGFDTIKYVVDTRNDSSNKQGYLQATGLKDYNIVGSLWLTKETGCILKYVIDDTDYGKNGEISKTHYEGGISRK
jgi:hypothetical protein